MKTASIPYDEANQPITGAPTNTAAGPVAATFRNEAPTRIALAHPNHAMIPAAPPVSTLNTTRTGKVGANALARLAANRMIVATIR